MSRAMARFRSDGSGAVLIEFALTLPLLLLVVVGIFDFGFLFQQYQVVTNAAREGARMAVLPGYTESDVKNRVDAYLNAGGVKSPHTTTAVPTLIAPGGGAAPIGAMKVTVTVDYTFKYLGSIAQLFGGSYGKVPLVAVSEMRTEVAAGGI